MAVDWMVFAAQGIGLLIGATIKENIERAIERRKARRLAAESEDQVALTVVPGGAAVPATDSGSGSSLPKRARARGSTRRNRSRRVNQTLKLVP